MPALILEAEMQPRCHQIKVITWERRRLARCRCPVFERRVFAFWVENKNCWFISSVYCLRRLAKHEKDNTNRPHTQKRTLTPTCTSCYQVPAVAKKGHVRFPNFAWRLLRDLLLTFPIRRRGRISRRARISRRLWSFLSEATTMACLYVLVVTHAPVKRTSSSLPFVSLLLFACVSAPAQRNSIKVSPFRARFGCQQFDE